MGILFLPDHSDNWLPGYCAELGDLPQFFLTPDRKILKKQSYGTVTYHLPETYQVVTFNNLGAAFQAAYGRPLPEEAAV